MEVRSAGSAPAETVNPAVIEAMSESGIDVSAETPKVLTVEAVQASDVVTSMGCGDTCPVFPGKTYLDWKLDDPAGQGVDAVRPIRDEIEVTSGACSPTSECSRARDRRCVSGRVRELLLCVSDFASTTCSSGAGHIKCVSPFGTPGPGVAQSGARVPLELPLDRDLGHTGGTPPPNWTRQQINPRPLTWGFITERVTRIELALSAWEADVLPLNYTRVRRRPSRCRRASLPYLMPGPRC